MGITKNTSKIRMFGGNDLFIKKPGGWESLGHVMTGTVEDKTDSQEITFADGNTIDLDGKRKVKVQITLAQTSKEELELVDSLRGGVYPLCYYNGIVDSKPQAFYFQAVNIIPNMTLKSPDNPMNIVLEMSAQPQSDVVSLNASASGALPTSTSYSGFSGTYTGKNNYYVILEGPGGSANE